MTDERFKIWGRSITAVITIAIGSAFGTCINYQIQTRQLDQQKLLNEAELKLQESKAKADQRQAEMVYLGQFLEHALTDDIKKRIRFAEYFSTLTISGDLRDKWKVYYKNLVALDTASQESKKELVKALQAGEIEKARVLETEVAQQQAQIQALPEKSDVYTIMEKAGLGKDWKPQNYTNNEFEVKTINGDKVVIDKATSLMWQQSGSDNYLYYMKAKVYVMQLNREQFAGHSDWRLPTLEEAMSLIEPEENSDGLYIDSRFNSGQEWIWTSSPYDDASSAWVVYFNGGYCYSNVFYNDGRYFVRAVR